MSPRTLALALLGLAPLAPSAAAQQLDPLVLGAFDWKLTAAEFEKAWLPRHFEWTSSAMNAARHPGRHPIFDEANDEVTWARPTIGEMEVGETIVRFHDGVTGRIEISVYNRGDDENLGEKAFEAMVADVKKLIGGVAGDGNDLGRDNRSAGRPYKIRWTGKTTDYQLAYSFQREVGDRQPFIGEFISLTLIPTTKNLSLLDAIAAGEEREPLSGEELRANVARKENGDVVIRKVPMVDQGDKGYCAVASAERVFRYYGLDVDQHVMAQIADSSARMGTSNEAMVAGLKDAAGRLKVHVRTHQAIEEYEDFENLVKDYNREARKNETREIRIRDGYILNMVGCYMAFDPETLKEAKLKGNGYERFRDLLREEIGAGVPILWSLFLGIYPEENIPQPSGGHMRLIIGYNDKTEEILYTDSWGAGHELKRMPMDNAYTMTTSLHTLQPFR